MSEIISICWFRRDLRLEDNAGLFHALKGPYPVVPLFIFDSNILEELEDKADRRVSFIYNAVSQMREQLTKQGVAMEIRKGRPVEVFKDLLKQYRIAAVYTNHDYEPYAIQRDREVETLLNKNEIAFSAFKDHVLLEKNEVLKDDGRPYTVFTPYSRKWKATLQQKDLASFPVENYAANWYRQKEKPLITLADLGFKAAEQSFPARVWSRELISHYQEQRDFPAIKGTSKLGVHLRFGTISIRQLAREAGALSETFLNELIWRDFYQMILWHFPQVVSHSFKPAYDAIVWRNNEKEFEAWCHGQTGYPIVDAGMRELNETGFMHNRVRMIVASFLTKHLLIDWRRGESYFAAKLLDFDLAANNGGWQWAAGSGCDAAPYFRVFNPYLQTKKFDPDLTYIKKWVPDYAELTYPRPVVDHEFARKRCLEVYAKALKSESV